MTAFDRRDALIALSSAIIPLSGLAQAEGWPARPVRLVVPFPPGGGTDVLARMLADRLRPVLNQTIVIDNRPGATGNIGNDHVAKSAPDGYTLLMQGTIIGMFPHIFQKLTYDPLKDLQAVGAVAESPNVIVVHPASPLQTIDQLVRKARENPAKPLNYGTAGVGSPQHLAMAQMAQIAGIKLQHISYKGTSPAVNDLLASQTDFGAFSLSSMLPLLQGNKLRVLAVMTEKRTALLPNVPSVAELGFQGVNSSIRFALFVPAATPAEVVAKLASANAAALADASLRENFLKSGYEVVPATGAQVTAMVLRENTVWGPIVRDLGLKPE
jgi:tripartite-type tricarboxylate transporter receptor subunit TctC